MKKGISMIDTLRDFIEKMERLRIDYMVTGSYAMAVYGEIRMTRDIDIVIAISTSDVHRFFELFKDEYYVNEDSILRAIDHKSMFNIVNNLNGGKIDCIVQKKTDFGRSSFARRYREVVVDVEFWATTAEDLIIAKLQWASETQSEMQIRDIANLTRKTYDSEYVEKWIDRLNLRSIWSEVNRWKIQHKPLVN